MGIPFLGITLHWITHEWQLKSMLFDFVPFRGSHTGALIFESFDDAIGQLRGRVLAIAGDNASNNDAFFGVCMDTYLGFTAESQIRCLAHIIHLAVGEFLADRDYIIEKLRALIKAVRFNVQLETFKTICETLQVQFIP